MTHTALEAVKPDAVVLNLVDGLYDLAIEPAQLQSQLMKFSRDAAGVAHRVHDGSSFSRSKVYRRVESLL